MNRPERRNALSLDHLAELRDAFAEIGESDARGVVLGGKGPVFSAGHDFADLAGADLARRAHAARDLHRPARHDAGDPAADRGPRARARHRRGLPARGDCRSRGRRGVGRVRRARWQGRVVLSHADGRDRPQRRAQARARARAHRRHHRRRDRGRLGTREPRRARRRARQSDPRPARTRDPRQRDLERTRQAGVLSPDRARPARRVRLRDRRHGDASQIPDAQEGMQAFLEKRPREASSVRSDVAFRT